MAAQIQFVDSISASPTVRLDLNDGSSWFCQLFKAPPPRLRRSESENSMRDGGVVGSSSYGNRTLELDLTLIEEGSEEWAADEMQKLWRELDRPSNFIRYWPEGLDKPVFFRTFRSDVSELEELWTVPIARKITLEILAEPFALGLKETLGPYAVNNDPAAASNGCYFDVTGVLGDVASPAVVWHGTGNQGGQDWLSVTPMTTPQFTWTQAEAVSGITLGVDTTNPGGTAAAGMSGTGSTNYVETTFATTTSMAERVRWAVPASTAPGTYRVVVLATTPVATISTQIQLWTSDPSQAVAAGFTASSRTVNPLSGSGTPTFPHHTVLDLGLVQIGANGGANVGYSGSSYAQTATDLSFRASGAAGLALRWDAFMLIPAWDTSATTITRYLSPAAAGSGVVHDGIEDRSLFQSTAGDPTIGAGVVNPLILPTVVGGYPILAPDTTNRFWLIRSGSNRSVWVKSTATVVSLAYWPRYLFVRPSAT